MKVVFVEIQTNETTGAVGVIANVVKDVSTPTKEMEAISYFHQLCASAAISAVDIHSIVALAPGGDVWRGCKASFYHSQEPIEE